MPEGNDNGTQGATPGTDQAKPTAAAKPAPPKGDEPLGDGGKKALEAERAARRELEQQMAQMREGLAKAFGGNTDPKATPDDVIAGLSKQVSDLRHEALVERVARTNGITDDGDIDFLRSARDEDAMTRLAGRLAAQAVEEAKPGTPKPDLTQGGQAASSGGTPPALNSDELTESLRRAVGAK